MPAQLAGLGIEGENAIGVEVVALAIVAIEVRTGVASGPVHQVELGIVGASHPSSAGAVVGKFALPGFRARLARVGYGPETPEFLAGSLIVGGDKSANAFVAPGRAGDHHVSYSERRGGSVVVLMPIRHFGFPQQFAVDAAEGHDMRVIGQHEQAVSIHRHAPIESDGGVAGKPLGAGPLIVLELASAAGIEREHFIGARNIHDAVGHDGRIFDLGNVGNREYPGRAKTGNVVLVDLRELGVTVAAGVPMISAPLRLGGDFAVAVPCSVAQEMNALVIALQLEFAHTLVEHAAFDAFSVGCLNSFAGDHRGLIACGRNQDVQIAHQRRQILCRKIEGGHASGRSAGAEERTKVSIGKGVDLGQDVGAGFAAGGVGPVAA